MTSPEIVMTQDDYDKQVGEYNKFLNKFGIFYPSSREWRVNFPSEPNEIRRAYDIHKSLLPIVLTADAPTLAINGINRELFTYNFARLHQLDTKLER